MQELQEPNKIKYLLNNYFCCDLRNILKNILDHELFFTSIQEIRLRVNKPIIIKTNDSNLTITKNLLLLSKDILSGYIITKKNLLETLELITNYSPYSFQEQIKNGFITIKGGHRIGLAGEIIIENNKIKSMHNISSINFRIANQIKDCSSQIIKFIKDPIKNIIIIGSPGSGKTTLLRDIIKNLSLKYKICVIDERSEIAGSYLGEAQNDLGPQTDILDKCPKIYGMTMALRTLSPEIIAVDEIGDLNDIKAMFNIINSGVKIICSVHANDLLEIKNKAFIKFMLSKKIIDRYIFLDNNQPGKIKNIYDQDLNKIY